MYATLLARLTRRLWVLHRTLPKRRALLKWVLATGARRELQRAREKAAALAQSEGELAQLAKQRRRGGGLHVARLVGLRVALAAADRKRAFYCWNSFTSRQNYHRSLAWFKIDGLCQTRRQAMLISAATRWKWLLGQRERRTENMIWVPRRNLNRGKRNDSSFLLLLRRRRRLRCVVGAFLVGGVVLRGVVLRGVVSRGRAGERAEPAQASQVRRRLHGYTHLMYGMSPTTPPTRATTTRSMRSTSSSRSTRTSTRTSTSTSTTSTSRMSRMSRMSSCRRRTGSPAP